MGYREFLIDMLKPMGIYNLIDGFSEGELTAEGDALDKVCGEITELSEEFIAETASDYGLSLWENLFPILNIGQTTEDRRRAVVNLMKTDDMSCTIEALTAQFSACGIPAEISETEEVFLVNVHFTDIRGEPDEKTLQAAQAIIPAQVYAVFYCDGLIWDRAEILYPTWNQFDNCGYTVAELLKLE